MAGDPAMLILCRAGSPPLHDGERVGYPIHRNKENAIHELSTLWYSEVRLIKKKAKVKENKMEQDKKHTTPGIC